MPSMLSTPPQTLSQSQELSQITPDASPIIATHHITANGAVIIGGGPAGLMAAQVLLERGVSVDLFEAMPTVARKFLYAGKSGMNITHIEAPEHFITRYAQSSDLPAHPYLTKAVAAFDNHQVKAWVETYEIETFVGSSGRVFPTGMKAAPLLRRWLQHLKTLGLKLHTRHYWQGWQGEGDRKDNKDEQNKMLRFLTSNGPCLVTAKACLLALGGGSWKKLGSDGLWQTPLKQQGIETTLLKPANCGFKVDWPEDFQQVFSGQPVKSITVKAISPNGITYEKSGDMMISQSGIEGGLVYALSAPLRDQIAAQGRAMLLLDLLPARSQETLCHALRHRGKKSISQCLKLYKISPIKQALLKQLTDKETFQSPNALAQAIKALPLPLTQTQPIDEAISTAGGVSISQLTDHFMSKTHQGLFFAGEMLDWEAPTGGYLLTACLATGKKAGEGMADFLLNE
ncbi:NAD(P)/FAD-dependent oxidoreductase [Oceanospirillum maris]|uniref:NAD(P)/FAD-dependent oxidoreductase n=1 Tax=Oceanospirillum maris TaxID=64977 RepID=UPI0003F6F214|nr:TIGR03862 family flavoprotein [Oceanospirillum maris]